MKKRWLFVFVIMLFLMGCGKQEEEVKNQITIASYDGANTSSEYVRRGDLDGKESVVLKLKASEETECFFQSSGILIERVYVTVGDEVKKGQLLAEAENEDFKQEVAKSEIAVTSLQEGIRHYNSMLTLEREKKEYNPDKKQTNLDIIEQYTLEIEKLQKELAVAVQKVSEAKAILEKTQIYAPMDGTVYFVGKYGNGLTTDAKMAFIKLRTNDTVFSGTIRGLQNMEAGTDITLSVGGADYQAVITAVEQNGSDTAITVTPSEYIDTTEVTYGEYVWNEEPLQDVLYVPTEAVMTIQGEYYVFVYDESGFPNPVKVKVGKMGPKYTNIISGVDEGELVELF